MLHLTDEPARAFRQASREIGRPVISLRTDDCQRDAEQLKSKRVVFIKEPSRMAYGGMDAVFDAPAANRSTSTRTDAPGSPVGCWPTDEFPLHHRHAPSGWWPAPSCPNSTPQSYPRNGTDEFRVDSPSSSS